MTLLSFSKPVVGAALIAASYGGGLNSTAMLHAAAHGLIAGPMPNVALYADNHSEDDAVVEMVDFMRGGNVLPFPLEVIDSGDLTDRVFAASRHEKTNQVPFWTLGADGREAMLNRGCTRDFKIDPVHRRLRELLGYPGRKKIPDGVVIEQWIGIGAEEVFRATPSLKPWIVNRWPLLELGWTRADCEAFLMAHGYPVPPKSRCVFCPYTSDERWIQIKAAGGEAWEKAVEVDESIRAGFKGTRHQIYVHRSLKPLREADFDPKRNGDLFNHECKGACGT